MNKLIPVDSNNPKLQNYQPHMGKVTIIMLADFTPAFPMYMQMLSQSANSLLTMHERAAREGEYSVEEMAEANPFLKAKIVTQRLILRTASLQYENVEIGPTIFAILEYLRLTGKVSFWYSDDGICAGTNTLGDLPERDDQ